MIIYKITGALMILSALYFFFLWVYYLGNPMQYCLDEDDPKWNKLTTAGALVCLCVILVAISAIKFVLYL